MMPTEMRVEQHIRMADGQYMSMMQMVFGRAKQKPTITIMKQIKFPES